MEIFYIILSFLSGIGVFLFGVKIMSNGLATLSGNKLKTTIHKLAKNRVKGAFFGIGITALFQSSTATTTLVVSLVSGGILSLAQAIPIIFGSNVGTVFTQAIVSFKIVKLTSIFAGLTGIFAIWFAVEKREKIKRILTPVLGFCLMFVGAGLMGSAELVNSFFATVLMSVKNGFLLFGLGFVLTILLQSSLASVIVLMGIGSSMNLSIELLAFILMGVNVGTTLTAILASIGGNVDSRRTAFSHVLFSVFGTILFASLTPTGYLKLISGFETSTQIVLFNLIFNLTMIIIMLPLTKPYTRFLQWLIKDNKPKNVEEYALSKEVMEIPHIAMGEILKLTIKLYTTFLERFKTDVVNFSTTEIKIEHFREFKAKFEKDTADVLAAGVNIFSLLTEKDRPRQNEINDRLADMKYILGYASRTFRFSYNLKKHKVDVKLEKKVQSYFKKTLSFCEFCLKVIKGEEQTTIIDIFNYESELTRIKKLIRKQQLRNINSNSQNEQFVLLTDVMNNIESIYAKYAIFAQNSLK